MSSRKRRAESGCFVAEGVKLCGEAVLSGITVVELYVTAEALRRYPEQTALLCEHARAVYEITEDLARKIADTEAPQGVYCVCETPQPSLTENSVVPGRYLALESLQDPGNLGTILRTADAFALDGVIMTADCPEIFSPKVLRSTMGSAFRVPVCTTEDLPALLRRLVGTHETYAATLRSDAVSIRQCDMQRSVVVAVGNEGRGLSQRTIDACARSVVIDMPGRAESLNAGVAAAVVMWEMMKRGDSAT